MKGIGGKGLWRRLCILLGRGKAVHERWIDRHGWVVI